MSGKNKLNFSIQDNPFKPSFDDIHLSVVLIGTETTGNVGAVARSMKNFSFSDLILVNPQCEISTETYGFAMHAKDIIDNIRIIRSEDHNGELAKLFESYHVIIGTSGKTVNYQHILRVPIYVDELELPLADENEPLKVAVVFGRESVGLTKEEVKMTDVLVTIPANPEYPIMNLSHAATVVLFTIYKKLHIIERGQIVPATQFHRNLFQDRLNTILDLITEDEQKKNKYGLALKNIIGRSFSSLNEMKLATRLLEKIIHKLHQS